MNLIYDTASSVKNYFHFEQWRKNAFYAAGKIDAVLSANGLGTATIVQLGAALAIVLSSAYAIRKVRVVSEEGAVYRAAGFSDEETRAIEQYLGTHKAGLLRDAKGSKTGVHVFRDRALGIPESMYVAPDGTLFIHKKSDGKAPAWYSKRAKVAIMLPLNHSPQVITRLVSKIGAYNRLSGFQNEGAIFEQLKGCQHQVQFYAQNLDRRPLRDSRRVPVYATYVEKYPGTLKSYLEKHHPSDQERKSIAEGIIRSLKELHDRKIFHYDVKLANILYDPVRNKAVLTNFDASRSTKHKARLQTDIWGLGKVLIHLLYKGNGSSRSNDPVRQLFGDMISVHANRPDIDTVLRRWEAANRQSWFGF